MKVNSQIHELGQLFEEVQLKSIFPDSKTFPDCIPKRDLEIINAEYKVEKDKPGFNLKEFVSSNFEEPPSSSEIYTTDSSGNIEKHISSLWNFLTRQSNQERSSIIALPKPYVVPGGRFREIYYWDSYFTMLGLVKSGRKDLALNMLENFSYLVDAFGYIPNGNRTYFLGRSQPPFFSLMVMLLAKEAGEQVLIKNVLQLEKEYSFWMNGINDVQIGQAVNRVVKLKDGSILNRYWDENDSPRPESFKEDIELSHRSPQESSKLFRSLRAAAESGWDFSSRWFKVKDDFGSIHTTDIIPVDLNCLLYELEKTLAEAYKSSKNPLKAADLEQLAERRKLAIRNHCWNEDQQFFFDFDFTTGQQKKSLTLAGCFPLFSDAATQTQAEGVASIIERVFMKQGGLTTTLEFSGQQWDAPNGWAPLQWIIFKGLMNYGKEELANNIKSRWMTSNEAVFNKSGKMTEKYDVWNKNADASGGEYPNQDGFGWTNGAYLALKYF